MMIYTLINPNKIIYLFFLIPLKIKWIIGSFLLIEILSLLKIDNISHIAHISGAFSGILIYLLYKYKILIN
jgi:membrane associated rhomboid family serine protease